MSFKWLLLQSVIMSIVTAVIGYQLEYKSAWFVCGLCIGLSAFNLNGWLSEVVEESRLAINRYGIHYVDGERYRLVPDDEKCNVNDAEWPHEINA